MSRKLAAALVSVLCLAACNRGAPVASDTATKAGSPIQGVWRLAEFSTTGPNGANVVNPAGIMIFANTHYSSLRVATPDGSERAQFKATQPVDAEKIAAYDSFVAASGTYELNGTTLTVRPTVSKHPNFMGGGYDTYEIRTQGDTLWMTGKSANIHFRMAGGLVTNTGAVTESISKLVRVE